MKKTLDWHHTKLGSIILFLGSIQLAVPVLVLVAIGLAAGTYIESTQNVRVARELVYGSWWFIATMALVCVSLVFAVIARFPLKRRHIGFVTVHASLIALIAAGFWSMFERVEGHLALQEGTMHNVFETADEQVEVLEHNAGVFNSLDAALGPSNNSSFTLAGVPVRVLERWENCREEEFVADDSPEPLRAVDIAPVAGPQTAWVGQPDKAGPPPMLLGLTVLVLPEGSDWTPPTPSASDKGQYVFVAGPNRFPLKNVGDEVIPGWLITELIRYERAIVMADQVREGPPGSPANPGVEVTISDGRGTLEKHIAFENFPDLIIDKPIEGSGNSASRLVAGPLNADPETIVIFGTVAATKIGYIGLDGRGKVLTPEMKYPMALTLGGREVVIHQQLARAHQTSRIVKIPVAVENKPAIVVRIGDSTESKTIPWKGLAPFTTPDKRTVLLHYGPRRVQLPFTLRLADFRKTDYPGTEMAMAYQSDVGISAPGEAEFPFEIYMNHPYTRGPWKVYQSGFMGEKMSIFSIMRDPGLWLTYVSSAFLCIGVVITFYSRSMSWGHPGIPIRPVQKESSHVPSPPLHAPGLPADAPRERSPVGVGH